MNRLAFVLVPLFLLAGCTVTATPTGSDDNDESRDNLSSETSSKKKKSSKSSASNSETKAPAKTADDTVDEEPPAAPPAGPDVTYGATLAETELVAFGGITADGKQVCGLQQWKNISIVVVANDKGLTKSFTFEGTNIEQANPACPGVTAAPEGEHRYTFTNAAPKDEPAKLVAAPGNQPQASLVADVAVHADAGGRVTLSFQRGDADGWKYTRQFQLAKQ